MTEGYKAMELQLRERRGKAIKAADVLERSLIQYFCDAEAEPGSPLAEEISQLQEQLRKSGGIGSIEEMLSLLDRAIEADVPVEAELAEKLTALREALQELQKDLALAENNEHNLKKYNGLVKELAGLRERLADCEKREQQLAEAEKALQEKIRSLQSGREQLSSVPERLAACQQEINALRELADRLGSLQSQQVPRYGRAKKRLAELQEGLESAQSAHAAAMRARLDGEMQLERNRAGILAKKLVAGQPCPVCGATMHPSPAELPEKAVTEADVKKLQQQEKQAEAARSSAAAEAAAARAELVTLDSQIGSYMLECLKSGCWLEAVARGEAFAMEIPAEAGLRQLYELVQLQAGQLAALLQKKRESAADLQSRAKRLQQVERELAEASGRDTEALQLKRQKLLKELTGKARGSYWSSWHLKSATSVAAVTGVTVVTVVTVETAAAVRRSWQSIAKGSMRKAARTRCSSRNVRRHWGASATAGRTISAAVPKSQGCRGSLRLPGMRRISWAGSTTWSAVRPARAS